MAPGMGLRRGGGSPSRRRRRPPRAADVETSSRNLRRCRCLGTSLCAALVHRPDREHSARLALRDVRFRGSTRVGEGKSFAGRASRAPRGSCQSRGRPTNLLTAPIGARRKNSTSRPPSIRADDVGRGGPSTSSTCLKRKPRSRRMAARRRRRKRRRRIRRASRRHRASVAGRPTRVAFCCRGGGPNDGTSPSAGSW